MNIRLIAGILVVVIVAIGGWFVADQYNAMPVEKETAIEHAKKHLDPKYVCPMHPQIVRDEPGSCPICGMDLVPVKQDGAENNGQEQGDHCQC